MHISVGGAQRRAAPISVATFEESVESLTTGPRERVLGPVLKLSLRVRRSGVSPFARKESIYNLMLTRGRSCQGPAQRTLMNNVIC